MRKITVTKKYNGKKISNFLLDNFESLSMNTIFKTLRKKDIKVNGTRINSNISVKEGDEIEIYITDDILFSKKSEIDLKIIYNIKNNIGADIYEIKIAPSGIDEYSEDVLKNKILKMSDSISVAFLPPDTYQYWDIQVLTENGNYYTWFNAEIGTFNEITLEIGDDGPVFETN